MWDFEEKQPQQNAEELSRAQGLQVNLCLLNEWADAYSQWQDQF